MSDVERMISKWEKQSLGFAALVDAEVAELLVGLRIRELRQQSNMTQEELARRIRTTKSAISRLENSSGGARLKTLEKVALALGRKLVIEFR